MNAKEHGATSGCEHCAQSWQMPQPHSCSHSRVVFLKGASSDSGATAGSAIAAHMSSQNTSSLHGAHPAQ